MKKIQCEMCGSNDLVKHDGLFRCTYCGMQYTPDEARKLLVEGTVKIDNSEFIKKQLRNARRAYEKEDWEEVEKYYNIVEQHDPSNIEAIFYSSFAKVKLSLIDPDIYKREQKFHVLARSISVLDDNYDKTKGKENEITIKRISADILNLTGCSFVYNYYKKTDNGVTSTYNDKYKTYQLFGRICMSFIESLENIVKVDKQMYMYYILTAQMRYVINQVALKRSVRKIYRTKLIATYERIKELDPSAVFPPVGPVPIGRGCYVATAVYGSYDCPEVWTLRRFRDFSLDKSFFGKLFIKIYYALSPTLVEVFKDNKFVMNFTKKSLDKFVSHLKDKGFEDTEYSDKY